MNHTFIERQLKELAAYVADYIAYERDKKPHGLEIDTYMILDAIDAFIGGAADTWFDANDDTYDEWGVNTKNTFNTPMQGA